MKGVMQWYEAFDKNDPSLLDRILDENWVDIPAAPSSHRVQRCETHSRRAHDKLPRSESQIREILQDGSKVIVRSENSGTHQAAFMDFPAKNRKLTIQAIDIHEFKDGKIVRTWHCEDWLSGLRQLGVFDR